MHDPGDEDDGAALAWRELVIADRTLRAMGVTVPPSTPGLHPLYDRLRLRPRAALLVALGVAGCGFSPGGLGGDVAPDASVSVDAADDAAVPGTGWLNTPCDPVRSDQCAPAPAYGLGLTCRLRTATTGLCRPVAIGAEGVLCHIDDDCGADMTCLVSKAGRRCVVVCAVTAPRARCGVAQVCVSTWGATGVCR